MDWLYRFVCSERVADWFMGFGALGMVVFMFSDGWVSFAGALSAAVFWQWYFVVAETGRRNTRWSLLLMGLTLIMAGVVFGLSIANLVL